MQAGCVPRKSRKATFCTLAATLGLAVAMLPAAAQADTVQVHPVGPPPTVAPHPAGPSAQPGPSPVPTSPAPAPAPSPSPGKNPYPPPDYSPSNTIYPKWHVEPHGGTGGKYAWSDCQAHDWVCIEDRLEEQIQDLANYWSHLLDQDPDAPEPTNIPGFESPERFNLMVGDMKAEMHRQKLFLFEHISKRREAAFKLAVQRAAEQYALDAAQAAQRAQGAEKYAQAQDPEDFAISESDMESIEFLGVQLFPSGASPSSSRVEGPSGESPCLNWQDWFEEAPVGAGKCF